MGGSVKKPSGRSQENAFLKGAWGVLFGLHYSNKNYLCHAKGRHKSYGRETNDLLHDLSLRIFSM